MNYSMRTDYDYSPPLTKLMFDVHVEGGGGSTPSMGGFWLGFMIGSSF